MANDSSSDEGDSLGDQIAEFYVESTFPQDSQQQIFLPHGLEDQIVTSNSIHHELYGGRKPLKTEQLDLINSILESAKKILIISRISGLRKRKLHRAMLHFKENGFVDTDLPVVISKNEPIHPLFPPKLWPALNKAAFLRDQWKLLAPVFPKKFLRLELQQDDIFPFTFVHPDSKTGTFGDVYQVTVHEAHQEEPMRKQNGDPANAAIKELKVLSQKDDPMYKEWEAEAKALEDTSGLGHPHVVQVRAIISKARRHYFMFQWADGGSLRDFYEKKPAPKLDAGLVRDVVRQILGLADALHALHNYKGEGSYRHGDLKPENILIFEDATAAGTWKIADMGLAKRHVAATEVRGPTSTRYGTPSYEPPEVVTMPSVARSRLYDIWSMGCITLELVIWLLYGDNALVAFNNSMRASSKHANPYWVFNHGDQGAKIHPKVAACIDYIKEDPECRGSTAIGDLLELVETKLLVVSLPKSGVAPRKASSADAQVDQAAGIEFRVDRADSSARLSVPTSTTGPFRATAEEFLKALQEIKRKGEGSKTYLFTGRTRGRFAIPSLQTLELAPQSASETKTLVVRPAQSPAAEEQNLLHAPSSRTQLNEVWDFPVDNVFATSVLGDGRIWAEVMSPGGQSSRTAQLCGTCRKMEFWAGEFLHTDKVLELERQSPFCDFCRLRRDLCKRLARGSKPVVHFDRLESTIRLNEDYPPVLTIHRDPGIVFANLPTTFQHAVAATRGLGVQYLWIDSLCIIQGPDGDFQNEAKRMEDVFSQADCVLAASSATGQWDGFLTPREARNYLTIQQNDRPTVYLCDYIDDFSKHVRGSYLNQRGWVLQERALARRTIYFTSKQTYWECGEGVRCETMTKMQNTLESFLGDPNFPKVAMESSRGGKIRLYQDLYMQYSRLAFTQPQDRPVAIAGLEQRLITSFGVQGGLGVFENRKAPGELRRSLLWHRAADVDSLEPINFRGHRGLAAGTRGPPTWSWMAYEGGIEYLDLPFGQVEWEKDDILATGTWSGKDGTAATVGLSVIARTIDTTTLTGEPGERIVFDVTNKKNRLSECVVLGRMLEPEKPVANRTHFVLLVTRASPAAHGEQIYHRVGVGSVPGTCIELDGPAARGKIV
ncbi:hypothetical protein SLS53_007810 [Cytospora paraplurivora]|uniref:Protein kinase domain-containing protein n=1 Tax=Cytospora paraplurivora TaxID=2898453 RepID=A0AAN9TZB3_9PEZI